MDILLSLWRWTLTGTTTHPHNLFGVEVVYHCTHCNVLFTSSLSHLITTKLALQFWAFYDDMHFHSLTSALSACLPTCVSVLGAFQIPMKCQWLILRIWVTHMLSIAHVQQEYTHGSSGYLERIFKREKHAENETYWAPAALEINNKNKLQWYSCLAHVVCMPTWPILAKQGGVWQAKYSV